MTYKANSMKEHIDKLTSSLLEQKEEYIYDAIKGLIKSGAITMEESQGRIIEELEGFRWAQEVMLKLDYQAVHPKCLDCTYFLVGSEGTSDHCEMHNMCWASADGYCSEHSDLKKR